VSGRALLRAGNSAQVGSHNSAAQSHSGEREVTLRSLIRDSFLSTHGLNKILGELRIVPEIKELLGSGVYHGYGVQNGNNAPVMLIPGIATGDYTFHLLKGWLGRNGYDVHTAEIMFNALHTGMMLDSLSAKLLEISEVTGQRVTLIGHSYGGVQAKLLSHRHPKLIDHVYLLGSPITGDVHVHPLIAPVVATELVIASFSRSLRQGLNALRGEPEHFVQLLRRPEVPTTSIYSETDGIVDPESCKRDDVELVRVNGSHIGFIGNKHVFEFLAGALPRSVSNPGPSSAKGNVNGRIRKGHLELVKS